MKLIAHRGASADAPENTMAAFRLAIEQRVDGLELDVWLTKDGRVAVIHDRNLKRTLGKKGRIDEMTAREAAKHGVPILGEVLELLPPGKRMYIEIKGGAELVPPLRKELAKFGAKAKEIMLLGFDRDVMAEARRGIRNHEVWLNVEPGRIGPVQPLITELRRLRFHGVSLGYSKEITPHVVDRFRRAKLGTTVWVVDDVVTARRMQLWGFDYLMTNRPAALRAVVSS
ncbi:MAG: glycerophosphodiester phosphodiesterase family protein [bacterium]